MSLLWAASSTRASAGRPARMSASRQGRSVWPAHLQDPGRPRSADARGKPVIASVCGYVCGSEASHRCLYMRSPGHREPRLPTRSAVRAWQRGGQPNTAGQPWRCTAVSAVSHCRRSIDRTSPLSLARELDARSTTPVLLIWPRCGFEARNVRRRAPGRWVPVSEAGARRWRAGEPPR